MDFVNIILYDLLELAVKSSLNEVQSTNLYIGHTLFHPICAHAFVELMKQKRPIEQQHFKF